jgi:hypothetical protein
MKRFIFILLCLFVSSNVVAQVQQKNVDLVGKVSLSVVPCNGVHVSGNYAYVLIRNNLSIVDISDPKNPTEVNRVKVYDLGQGAIWDFCVTGTYVYIAYTSSNTNQSGVIIIDVSDPKKAKEVGSYSCHPYGVFVSGKYAYVTEQNGLIILDVSDPKNPKKEGSCMPPEVQLAALKLYVAGNYAYVINLHELYIIDVSDPQNPEFIAKHSIQNFPYAIYIVGNYAYVVAILGDLHIIDVSVPNSPKELSNYGSVGMMDICVAGDYAYVCVVDTGLRVIDVSNPNKPNEVGFYNPPQSSVDGVDVAGVYAYIVAYTVEGGSVLSIVKYENATKTSVDPKGKLSTTWGHLKQ